MKFFESHAHYNDEKFIDDREPIMQKIQEEGIETVICAGYNISSSLFAIEIANRYPFAYATCGISPNDIPPKEEMDKQLKQVEKIVEQNKKVVAIGEIGLDYYWNKDNKVIQRQLFEQQIQIANRFKLPIVIHARDAYPDVIKVLTERKVLKGGVFHCCQLNQELVREALNLGFYISLAGPITFKNSKNADEIIKMIPLDKLLIETDSPYLSPEPKRGSRNDSTNLIYIAEKVAQVKRQEVETIAKITSQNGKSLFGIGFVNRFP